MQNVLSMIILNFNRRYDETFPVLVPVLQKLKTDFGVGNFGFINQNFIP